MTEWIYGKHAVEALIKNRHRKTKQLYVAEQRGDDHKAVLELAEAKNIPVEILSLQKMNQRFPDAVHQGMAAMAGALPEYHEADIPKLLSSGRKPPLVVILDGVTDPHNLGACLRTADAAGAECIIIPRDKSAGMTPVVSKVASGAAESVPLIRVTNLVRAIEALKKEGFWIYGAAGEAKLPVYDIDFKGPVAIVLGAEGDGMRRLTREHCDGLFFIPMAGTVSSLNVSVAAGVVLYEVVRQRL